MFDSVLGVGVGAQGRPGVGAAVSLATHALLLTVALVLSHPVQGPLPLPPIHFPAVHLGSAPAGASTANVTPARPPRATRARTFPSAAPPVLPSVDVAPSVESPADVSEGGDGPQPAGPPSACLQPPCNAGARPGGESPILLLGPEMVPPRLLSGPEPRYPAEAALEHLGGTVLLRCTVTAQGTVENCTVLKSAPLLVEAALRAVTVRRYAPALYEGAPVSVWLVLPVRFVPP